MCWEKDKVLSFPSNPWLAFHMLPFVIITNPLQGKSDGPWQPSPGKWIFFSSGHGLRHSSVAADHFIEMVTRVKWIAGNEPDGPRP